MSSKTAEESAIEEDENESQVTNIADFTRFAEMVGALTISASTEASSSNSANTEPPSSGNTPSIPRYGKKKEEEVLIDISENYCKDIPDEVKKLVATVAARLLLAGILHNDLLNENSGPIAVEYAVRILESNVSSVSDEEADAVFKNMLKDIWMWDANCLPDRELCNSADLARMKVLVTAEEGNEADNHLLWRALYDKQTLLDKRSGCWRNQFVTQRLYQGVAYQDHDNYCYDKLWPD